MLRGEAAQFVDASGWSQTDGTEVGLVGVDNDVISGFLHLQLGTQQINKLMLSKTWLCATSSRLPTQSLSSKHFLFWSNRIFSSPIVMQSTIRTIVLLLSLSEFASSFQSSNLPIQSPASRTEISLEAQPKTFAEWGQSAAAILTAAVVLSTSAPAFADEYGRETEADTLFTGETTMVRTKREKDYVNIPNKCLLLFLIVAFLQSIYPFLISLFIPPLDLYQTWSIGCLLGNCETHH